MKRKMHNVHLSVKHLNASCAFAHKSGQMHHLHMDIARFRKFRGLTQKEMAEILGCNQSTVQRAEAMDKSAKIKTYIEYADALNVRLYDLFSEDATPDEIEILKMFRRIPISKHDELIALLRLARESDDGEGEESTVSGDPTSSKPPS